MAGGDGQREAEDKPSGDAGRMKVFISYSRRDVAFADELELALSDRGFDVLVDRHDIDAGEEWKQRLGELIFACDTVVFVLSEASAGSPICAWEVEEAARVGKRRLVVTPAAVPGGVSAPPQLAGLNWIHCWRNPDIPGSSFTKGVLQLEQALKVDLAWLRQHTRLQEQATLWSGRGMTVDSPHLLRGDLLREALDHLGRKPADAMVSEHVASFIAASEAHEARLKAEADAGIAEREAALAQKSKVERSMRRLSIISLAAGLALLAVAGWGLFYAAQKAAEAGDRRAELFAQASLDLEKQGEYSLAAMVAVAGDPTAKAELFESIFRPDGYASLRAALVRAHSADRLIREIAWADDDGIPSMAPLPDGRRYLVWDDTQKVGLWEAGKTEPDKTFTLPDGHGIDHALPLADGDRVVIRWEGSDVTALWSLSQGKQIAELRDGGRNSAMSLDPSGTHAAMTDGTSVMAWNLDKLAAGAVKYEGVKAYVSHVAYEPVLGRYLMAADISDAPGERDKVHVWAVNDPSKPLRTVEFEEKIGQATWRNGVLVVLQGGKVQEFFPDGKNPPQQAFNNYHFISAEDETRGLEIRGLQVSPNRELIWFGSNSEYDLRPGLVRSLAHFRIDLQPAEKMETRRPFVKSIFLPAAGALVTVDGDNNLSTWDVGLLKAESLAEIVEKDGTLVEEWPYLSAAGKGRIVTVGDKTRVLQTGAPAVVSKLAQLPRGSGIVNWDTSPDAMSFAGHSYTESAVKIWRAGREELAGEIKVQTTLKDFVFSPDSEHLLLLTTSSEGSGAMAQLYRVGEATPVSSTKLPKLYGYVVAVSPDNKSFLVADESHVELWRFGAKAPEPLCDENRPKCITTGRYVTALAFTPDGGSFVIGDDAGELRIYGVDGGLRHRFEGRGEVVATIRFSADGKMMLTLASDATAKLWRVDQTAYLQSFDLSDDVLSSADFDADGRHILIVGRDTMARIPIDPLLFAPPDELVRSVCEQAAQKGFTGFTQEQRARYAILTNVPDNPCIARGIIKAPPPKPAAAPVADEAAAASR